MPPLRHEGNIHTDHLEKAEILNKYFASVFTVNPGSPLPPQRESSTSDITPISIDPHGVKCLLDGFDIFTNMQDQIIYLAI